MKTALQILIDANEKLVSTPLDKWCTFVYARDSLGICVLPNSENACRWCAIGALLSADDRADLFGIEGDSECEKALHLLAENDGLLQLTELMKISDAGDKAEVIARYERAIQKAKESRI